MDPCKELEPRVIDEELILKCIDDEVPKGEIGRLTREEGINIEEVTQIRFEYKNILRIDHLWVLPALTKLCLNNNFIEQIENLDTLVNLKELDLSFNKISKIQNLDKLVNIFKLSLFDNLITTIENMERLKKLTVFSIGNNLIEDVDNVIYLRKFPTLTSLNMAGNPCAQTDDFRSFIAIFLPKIAYYEYISIKDEERELGAEIFSEKLRDWLEYETTELEILEEKEKEIADAELHSKSFVEYLNSRHLFDQLFEEDEEGVILLEISEEVRDYQSEFEENFILVCQQIFQVGESQYLIRQSEHDEFLASVEQAKKENSQRSIDHMEAFMEFKTELFNTIKYEQKAFDECDASDEVFYDKIDELVAEFESTFHKTWKQLMKLEMELFEQMEEINQTFEHTMNDLFNNFIEEVQGLFSQLRTAEISYFDNISDCASRYMANSTIDKKFVIAEILRPIMTNRETLSNALGASHDKHLQVIDNREDTLVSRARQYHNDLVTNLVKGEVDRNRSKVLEINHFLDIQRQEFDDLFEDDDDF